MHGHLACDLQALRNGSQKTQKSNISKRGFYFDSPSEARSNPAVCFLWKLQEAPTRCLMVDSSALPGWRSGGHCDPTAPLKITWGPWKPASSPAWRRWAGATSNAQHQPCVMFAGRSTHVGFTLQGILSCLTSPLTDHCTNKGVWNIQEMKVNPREIPENPAFDYLGPRYKC